MYHVVISWAGSESETTDWETEEEAKEYLKDVIGPGTNSSGYIYKD